jgi:TRAP-type transport system periplasmic protein
MNRLAKGCGAIAAIGLASSLMVTAVPAASGAASGSTYTIKWAIGQDKTGIASDAVRAAAFTIEKKTKTHVKIDIYYSGQLGSNTAVMTQLIHNVAQMFTQDTNTMSTFWKTATFTDLPYLFTTATQAYAYWTSKPGKQEKAAIQSKLGIRFMNAMGFGFHSILSTAGPITGLSSFQGLKICSPSSEAVNIFLSAVGAQEVVASTIPNEYTDVEQGLCQVIEMGPSSLVGNKFTAVAKDFTFSRTLFQFASTWMNNTFYEKLPNKYRHIISAALLKVQKTERAAISGTTSKTGTYAEEMRGDGVTLSNLPASGRSQIAKVVKAKVFSQVGSAIGPTAAKWLREWESVKSKTTGKTK